MVVYMYLIAASRYCRQSNFECNLQFCAYATFIISVYV